MRLGHAMRQRIVNSMDHGDAFVWGERSSKRGFPEESPVQPFHPARSVGNSDGDWGRRDAVRSDYPSSEGGAANEMPGN